MRSGPTPRAVVWWIVLAAMLGAPAAGRGEMYLEGYIGGSFAGNAPTSFVAPFDLRPGHTTERAILAGQGLANPSVIGGIKVGTWFVKEGFLGFDYPNWMQYFGVYVDVSHHRLDMLKQSIHGDVEEHGVFDSRVNGYFASNGTVTSLALMFPVRYGFLPSPEVPFGRLQPYVAVGPALMCSTMQPTVTFAHSVHAFRISADSASRTDLGFALDAGIRWMVLANVSVDLFYKMRAWSPRYSFDYADPAHGSRTSFNYDPGTCFLHSVQLGLAYHF